MQPIFILIFGVLAIACLLLTGLILPGLVIADVAQRSDLTSGKRRAWIVANIFFGPLASVPYAFRRGGKPMHKALSVLFILFIPMFVWGVHRVDQSTRGVAVELLDAGESIALASEISPKTKKSLSETIGQLRTEIIETRWYQIQTRAKATALAQVLAADTEDDRLTETEAAEWLSLGQRRAEISALDIQQALLKRMMGN